MKNFLFKSLSCSALLFSSLFLTACGGDSVPKTVAVEVSDKNFSGPYAEVVEIVDNNLEIKFEKIENRYEKDPGYEVTIPYTIKVIGENKDLDLYTIPIDFLDANGAVIKSFKIDIFFDAFKQIKKDIQSGVTGNAYKIEIKESLDSEEAQKFMQEVKSVKGGLLDGHIEDPQEQKKSSGNGLYVKDANFSGPFGNVIKIKDSTYRLKTEDPFFKGETEIIIEVDIEVLKQSSSEIEGIYLNFVNESGTTISSIYNSCPTALNEMIKNGDIGKSYLMRFFTFKNDEEADIIKNEAVAISGGATTAK